MKTKHLIFLLFLSGGVLWAQDQEKLGIQEVQVTKSYTPSLSDVFKIRAVPEDIDSLKSMKIPIDFKLLAVPVVSTFVPNKATPLKLQRQESTIQYNSLLELGVGNRGQLDLDFGTSIALDRQQFLGFDFLRHQRRNVPNTVLKSGQSQTLIGVAHDYYNNNSHSSQQLRFETHGLNYYGIPTTNDLVAQFQFENLDPKQTRNFLKGVSHWEWYDSFVQKATLSLQHTSDYFDTSEQLVHLKTQIRIPIFDAFLAIDPELDLVHSAFKRDYYDNEEQAFKQLNFGTGLQIINLKNRFKYKLGVRAYYLNSGQSDETQKLFLYPDLTLLYQGKKSKIRPYLTLDGALENNSYTAFSDQNPYIAPSLVLMPTDRQWAAKLGFNTVFDTGVSFGFESFYTQKRWAPLFQKLAFNPVTPLVPYGFTNSFEVLYDHQKTYGARILSSLELQENNRIDINIDYAHYDQDTQVAAWNLPNLTANIKGNFLFFDRIGLFVDMHYFGNRTVANRSVFLNQSPASNTPEAVRIKGVTQTQIESNYRLNDQWNVFVKSQFFFGESAQLWHHFPTYNHLLLFGIRYQFDLTL